MTVFDFSGLSHRALDIPALNTFQARDGCDVSYRFYESENKEKAIILLHGSSAHGEYLHPLAKYLSSNNLGTVYVPNIRGHYGSGVKGDCEYIGQLEDDLYDLIQKFQLENKKIYLIGHSSGGGLAIRFAGSSYRELIQGYILLSPAIPRSPTMREGTANGWAKISLLKMIFLAGVNSLGIHSLNSMHVIQFHRPKEFCDGTETLSYSLNLNSSYHPRYPYQKDIQALGDRYVVFIGSEDEANDPMQFQNIMPKEHVVIFNGVKHLDIVCNPQVMEKTAAWIRSIHNQ